MGFLEAGHRKRLRRNTIKHAVLATIAMAGLLSVALVAPNVILALKKMGILPLKRAHDVVRTTKARLILEGLLTREGKALRLTQKGESVLQELELQNFKLKKPRRWDGRWRVLMFDIPERRKKLRDKLRYLLQSMGFVRLQDSVWLYPYDCEDIITLLKADLYLGKNLLYLIVDTLEYDGALRRHFGLEKYKP